MAKELLPTISELIDSSTTADLIQNREETLRKKLEVLMQMVHSRLSLHANSASQIDSEILPLQTKLEYWQENQDLGLPVALEQMRDVARSLSGLSQETRSRESDCWRDVVSIVRDIMVTWEALQGAKARSLMIHESGPDDTDDV